MTATDPQRGPTGGGVWRPDARARSAADSELATARPEWAARWGSSTPLCPSSSATATSFLPLTATVIVSVAVGLGIAGLRLLRGERVGLAAGGPLGSALTISIGSVTGSARAKPQRSRRRDACVVVTTGTD